MEELAQLQETLHKARAELQQEEGERRIWQQDLTKLQDQERHIQKLATEKTAVLTNKEEAINLLASIDEQLDAISGGQNQYIESKAELDSLLSQQTQLRKEMDTLKQRINRLEEADLDSECPTCGQPLSEEHRSTILTDIQIEGKETADRYRANATKITGLEGQVQQLQGAIKQKPRLERDQKTQQQRLAQAEARLSEIEQSEAEWSRDGENRLTKISKQLADEINFKAQQAGVAELQSQLQSRAALQKEHQSLQDEVSTARATAKEMDRQIRDWETEGQARLKTVRKELSNERYAPEAREALAELQVKIVDIGYDSAAHQEANAQKDALSGIPTRYQELKQAEAVAEPLKKTLSELDLRIQEQETDLTEQDGQLQSANSHLESLIIGSGDLQATEDAVFRLREDEIAAARLVGAAQQRVEVLQELRVQKKALAKEKSTLSLRIQQLKLLEKSCGRGGVQALLIEHALPEIEERANQLLDRLTGGDMRISFDTQRKLKSRDAMAETLDIRIADKDGERPYDNYSGGEQFRVNFAIRLALSQLLAQRAGARLQTLVVDEGFGSQDPRGRQRLVEAINAVRDEFACILIITHIEELRDAFSTRIEVQKDHNGSTIKVI